MKKYAWVGLLILGLLLIVVPLADTLVSTLSANVVNESVAIIGGADGPTAQYLTQRLFQSLLYSRLWIVGAGGVLVLAAVILRSIPVLFRKEGATAIAHNALTPDAVCARRFRMAAVLSIVYIAAYLLVWGAGLLYSYMVDQYSVGIELLTGYNQLLYNSLTNLLYYGIQIAVFAFLAAAKPLKPSDLLLKIGSIVAIVGLSLELCIHLAISIISCFATSSFWPLDPQMLNILAILGGDSAVSTIIDCLAPLGSVLCCAAFFLHRTKPVNITAIALAVVAVASLLVEQIPMLTMYEAVLSFGLNLVEGVLMFLLFSQAFIIRKQPAEAA